MATEQPVSLGVSQMEVTLVAQLSRRTHDLLQPTRVQASSTRRGITCGVGGHRICYFW